MSDSQNARSSTPAKSETQSLRENLELRLRRETHGLYRTRLLTAAMFGALLSPVLGVVDVIASRTFLPDISLLGFLALRLGVTVWFIALWGWFKRATWFPIAAMDWLLFAPPALALGYLTAAAGGAASPYVLGTTLLVIARTILVPGAARRHLPVVSFLVSSYPLALLAFAPKPEGFTSWVQSPDVLGPFVANFVPLCAVAGVGLVASDMIHTIHQRLVSARSLGRYKIKRELGRGAMGVVYLAWHRDLGRPCVIKLVSPDQSGSQALRSRFEREARETSLLRSPYTVDVFDFGVTQEGQLFYVMEYLDGISLEVILERRGAQPPDVVARWMTYVCEGLAEAHHRGLIHRDLKPGNLFLARTADGRRVVKLLDFGIARKEDDRERTSSETRAAGLPEAPELTAVGMVMGTPLYVAPEVLQGHAAGPASDQYSLAATAFHLITGGPVFSASTIQELLYKTVQEQPRRPSDVVPGAGVPAGLDAVLLRALSKRPDDRFESMEAFRQALEPFAGPAGTSRSDAAVRPRRKTSSLFDGVETETGPAENPGPDLTSSSIELDK